MWEVIRYFLRLGTIGFGGPPAHLAIMEDDLVRRRRWIDSDRFAEVVGVTNLIPGPNSTEIAIHIGYLRGGPLGGIATGVAFIAPAFAMMLVISWLYFRGGGFPLREELLTGIQPVALAAIVAAMWRLRGAFLGGWRRPLLAVIGFGLTLWVPPVVPLVILGGGFANLLATAPSRAPLLLGVPLLLTVTSPLPALAWVFLRTGALLFGGGLVLLPLLAPEVLGRGWLTEGQLLDGIALGQATPGPVSITSVFVGWAVAGFAGAVVATVAVFLPGFVAVLAGSGPFLRRFRDRPAVAAFVEGITATGLGTVGAAVVRLAEEGLGSPLRIGLFAAASAAILARVPVVVVLLAGAALAVGAGALGLV